MHRPAKEFLPVQLIAGQFLLAVCVIGPWLAVQASAASDGADALEKGLANFQQNARTEDGPLNKILDRIYSDCFFGREREPDPPSLVHR